MIRLSGGPEDLLTTQEPSREDPHDALGQSHVTKCESPDPFQVTPAPVSSESQPCGVLFT